MPGKVNPVIVENMIQIGQRVLSNDQLIKQTVTMGNTELNAFMPLIAETLLESLKLLIKGIRKFRTLVIDTIVVNTDRCLHNLNQSHSIIIPLIDIIGYEQAADIVKEAGVNNLSIRQVLLKHKMFTEEELATLLSLKQCTHPRQRR